MEREFSEWVGSQGKWRHTQQGSEVASGARLQRVQVGEKKVRAGARGHTCGSELAHYHSSVRPFGVQGYALGSAPIEYKWWTGARLAVRGWRGNRWSHTNLEGACPVSIFLFVYSQCVETGKGAMTKLRTSRSCGGGWDGRDLVLLKLDRCGMGKEGSLESTDDWGGGREK